MATSRSPGVTFDSREVRPGDLFIALKGEAHDGHRFVDKAFANGAAGGAWSTEPIDAAARAASTTPPRALERSRRAPRARGRRRGSSASPARSARPAPRKRSSPRSTASRRAAAHRSVKSYNNHTGVPLSLARMPRDSPLRRVRNGHEPCRRARRADPAGAPACRGRHHHRAGAHREFFGSEEAIADAKGEIFEGLEPGGTAIIPFDSPHRDRLIAAARPLCRAHPDLRPAATAPTSAPLDAVARPDGGIAGHRRAAPSAQLSFTIAEPGEHWVTQRAGGARRGRGGRRRSRRGRPRAGRAGRAQGPRRAPPDRRSTGGEALLIDESYNANPASMARDAEACSATSDGRAAHRGARRDARARRPSTDDFHAALAEPLEAAHVDYAILVGEEMARAGEGAWPGKRRIGACARRGDGHATLAARGDRRRATPCSSRDRIRSGLPRLVEALAGRANG